MNQIKRFLSLLAIFAIANISQGATATASPTGASTNQVLAGQLHITQIQVNNDSTNALRVKFFDATATNLTFVVGAYTNTLTYATNIVVNTTNIFGVTTSVTNSAVYTIANAVGQSTNSYRILTQVNVAASSQGSFPATGAPGVYTSYGLLSTNNEACTLIITYYPIQ